MRRISLVGAPGSGKTTLGRQLAVTLGVPFIELDGILHQPGWTDLTSDEFRARVAEAIAVEGWVVDGNYGQVQDLVWGRADTVLWLDLPRRVVMLRVVLRTIRRALTREELWNGNREPLSNFYRWDPERNIMRWTWVKYPEYVERYSQVAAHPPRPDLRIIRLGSDDDGRRLLRRCTPGSTDLAEPGSRVGSPGALPWHSAAVLEVRQVGPDAWQEWRSIRLRALAESPQAFTTRLEDWQGAGDTQSRWRDRLHSVPFNVVAYLDGRSVGMVSAGSDPSNRSVELLSLWVAPEERGGGVGDSLVSAVVEWARAHAARSLVLRVIEGNGAAERLYLRHGLRRSGRGGPGPGGPEIEMERSL
jgi:adenylate kinase family enzyme/GNAT superfamily N-acetyltransferase